MVFHKTVMFELILIQGIIIIHRHILRAKNVIERNVMKNDKILPTNISIRINKV